GISSGRARGVGALAVGDPHHHRLPAPRALAQVHPAPPGAHDVHAPRDLDAHQHLAQGMGRRPPQAPQLQRRRRRPPQPPHRGVLADHDRQRLLLPPRGQQRRYDGEVRRRPPLRQAGHAAPAPRHFRLLPDGRGARRPLRPLRPRVGHRSWPRGARDARGRLPAAQRRHQRGGAHLRVQELRERRDEPQAAGARHLRGGPAQQPPRPPGVRKTRRVQGRVRPRVARDPSSREAPPRRGPNQGGRGLGGPPPPHPAHHGEPSGHQDRTGL
ncbi:MAG: Fatty acid desaturase; Delta-9 fatty acid desaturase, partial [uncultured Rubrobacteraceae bacterium]